MTLPINPDSAPTPLLSVLCRAGEHRFALDAQRVERVLPMAELTPEWPPVPPRCGVLNVAGQILSVVDARQVLHAVVAKPALSQRLILLRTPVRHLLWVDEVRELAQGERRGQTVVFESGELWPLLEATMYPVGQP